MNSKFLFSRVVLSLLLSLSFSISLVNAENNTLSKSSQNSSKNIFNSFFSNTTNDDLLDADEAFALNVLRQGEELWFSWLIAKDYYLYQNRFEVLIDNQPLSIPTFPKGLEKEDPLFGNVIVYYHSVTLKFPIEQFINSKELQIFYQGCAEIGVCYPPQKKSFLITNFLNTNTINQLSTEQTSNKTIKTSISAINKSNNETIFSEADYLTEKLNQGSWWAIIGLFFVAGLLLSLTPCFFPMIPILSGILVNQTNLTKLKAFNISLVYVLSMGVAYSIAGILAGLFGQNLQATLQNPVILMAFSSLFIVLAFSMFGFYNLQLPVSWQNKIAQLSTNSSKQHSGSYIGTIIMGFLSALIIGPCAAPALAGALIYIGQSGDAVLGGIALFTLSMGLGSPLILYATLGAQFLPKSGAWMEKIKYLFGALMIALAIYLIDRITPIWLSMILWSLYFIISAVYLGVFEKIKENSSGWFQLKKGLAWILFLIGIILLIGVSSGGKSLLQPLKHLTANNSITYTTSDWFEKVYPGPSFNQSLEQTFTQKKPTMIYVTAQWCISCKELETFTFNDKNVINLMANNNVKAFKVDVTNNNTQDKAFQKKYNIIGPPAILFFDSQGKEIKNFRIIGFINAEDFSQRIELWKQS